ncbi:ABC transporter substrate-binding protein [Aquabacter cavernae]|uniref:ABC transporter substrate-binding protein n=1 Tax=Aquabacter cavernae TaxID=2496029 RepID=UPI000F8C4AA7|nr:ABC transporter substrate-binding protein [Aquabacter cavernae]
MKIMTSLAALLASASLCHAADISGGVVKIGVLNDQSGVYADFGGRTSVDAARMAAEDFNAKNKSIKVEIVSADHQSKVDVASSIAKQWFEAEGVDAIADLTNSAVAIAVNTMGKDLGKITLMTAPLTTALSNESCSPTGFHWGWDTFSQSVGTASALLQRNEKDWFILAADYAFGAAMTAELDRVVTAKGGKIVGQVKAPLGAADFSSFLLRAQSSKAQIVALANGGMDTINAIKQAGEFGIAAGGQKLAGLAVVISDVHALGLKAAQGLIVTTPFYWDHNAETRAFSQRFYERTKRMPGVVQAATYSAVLHYLQAIAAAGTDNGTTVAEKMRATPVHDAYAPNGRIRPDGRMVTDMYLVEVKTPAESKGAWDYFKVLDKIPDGDTAAPLSASKCPLVKEAKATAK